ncbi:hypothetical protein [Trichlorobacter ammonificans]|uniref:Lipoprotein n=1 Tax=Trichlorobacter ammonificans TaxID=2916410 RepID=A0ABN8HKH6_9BACT|nr:hypothetical protein [Trichlorobacter ammonificans]CAH2032112.1 conserved protein of unknown function [Trichlorobacter ammonificans]
MHHASLTAQAKLLIAALLAFALFGLSGCATGMSALECGVESMNPTVMAALDSFESAAISIKLSNRVLLQSPLSEQDTWPSDLQGAPSGGAALKMGLSLLGSSQGVTVPLEIDPETGFPRPTSALYLFLKERQELLDKHVSKEDVRFFRNKPQDVYYRELAGRKKPDTIHEYVYRNPLMAYGVVANNKNEMLNLEAEIALTARGYTQCDAFLRKASATVDAEVKKAACKDPALKDEAITAALKEKTEDMATMEKNYGKLANKVYAASVAGADFSMAALVKIGCAVVNGVRAFPNINNEFKGLKGAYNAAMLFPRIKMVLNSLGIYKDNLGLQYTVYKTMYEQLKGKYQLKEEEPEQGQKVKEALRRIELAEAALKELEPKLQLAFAGEAVAFSSQEAQRLERIAALFPEAGEPSVRLARLLNR